MSRVHICIDCRHIRPTEQGAEYAKCGRTQRIDVVTSEELSFFCRTERSSMVTGDCGPLGNHFEPKESP